MRWKKTNLLFSSHTRFPPRGIWVEFRPFLKKTKIPVVVQKLLNARAIARAEKDWKESDRLREEIKKIEFEVQDSADGGQTVTEI